MWQESTCPSLSAVDDLIIQGREIPVFLERLVELELHAATARTWLQKAAEAFLIDRSHSLISASVQHTFLVIIAKISVTWCCWFLDYVCAVLLAICELKN